MDQDAEQLQMVALIRALDVTVRLPLGRACP
jgi:hypothetical protein